jgi:hypothetical protein
MLRVDEQTANLLANIERANAASEAGARGRLAGLATARGSQEAALQESLLNHLLGTGSQGGGAIDFGGLFSMLSDVNWGGSTGGLTRPTGGDFS